jgi:hypothetical protein
LHENSRVRKKENANIVEIVGLIDEFR